MRSPACILGGQSSGGTTQVDFEVDHQPPADSPPGDLLQTTRSSQNRLITMVSRKKKRLKNSSEK